MSNIYPVYSNTTVFESTYNLSLEMIANNIPGDFVECGIALGSMVAQMSKANIEKKAQRKVYGFDSFQGIPWGTENDTEQPGIGKIPEDKIGKLETSGISSYSLNIVTDKLKEWGVFENVILVEGWFQDTIPLNTLNEICMLRLDGDMYESTKICLEFLYPKVSKGGVVIIDDYNLEGCRRAVHEYLDKENIKVELIEVAGIKYWVK